MDRNPKKLEEKKKGGGVQLSLSQASMQRHPVMFWRNSSTCDHETLA